MNKQRVLYPRFLDDPAEYREAESFWKKQWQELMEGREDQNEWREPWIQNVFANARPCLDGNPIFSAICSQRRLAVRVIQLPSLDGREEFSFWTDTYEEDQPFQVRELVLSCVLTDRSIYYCLDAINQWVDTEEVRLNTGSEYVTLSGDYVVERGPYALIMPVEQIQAMRDRFQEWVDQDKNNE